MPHWIAPEEDQLDRWGHRSDQTAASQGLANVPNAVVVEDLKMVYRSGEVEVSTSLSREVISLPLWDQVAVASPRCFTL